MEVCRGISLLISALVEGHVVTIVTVNESLTLVDFMLEVTSHPSKDVAINVMVAWQQIETCLRDENDRLRVTPRDEFLVIFL